ncbi:MAG: hypothetical protein HQ565_02935 [Bacteroidetes bacterium]|nr:hypothetical protein [Bacteroidota bacterium]
MFVFSACPYRLAGMSFAANPVSCWVKDTEIPDMSTYGFKNNAALLMRAVMIA